MKRKHWLYRADNIRRLTVAGGVLLLATVLLQLGIRIDAHFGIDGGLGFYAAFGLLTCAAMVLVAKLLGLWVKRDENYYTDAGADAPASDPGGHNDQPPAPGKEPHDA